jgi:hypothetical protein
MVSGSTGFCFGLNQVAVCGAMGLSVFGCTTRYSQRGPVEVVASHQGPSPTMGSAYAVDWDGNGEVLGVRVRPARCETRFFERKVVHDARYAKASFISGIGLALGGAVVGGVGGVSFATARHFPKECNVEDSSCVSRDDVRAASYVAWGLAGVGVVVGLVRAFKDPKYLGSEPIVVQGDQLVSTQEDACPVRTIGVNVSLFINGQQVAEQPTDERGFAFFRLGGRVLGGARGFIVAGDVRQEVELAQFVWEPEAPPALPESEDVSPSEPSPAPEVQECPSYNEYVDRLCEPVVKGLLSVIVDRAKKIGARAAVDRILRGTGLPEEVNQALTWILVQVLNEAQEAAAHNMPIDIPHLACCRAREHLAK